MADNYDYLLQRLGDISSATDLSVETLLNSRGKIPRSVRLLLAHELMQRGVNKKVITRWVNTPNASMYWIERGGSWRIPVFQEQLAAYIRGVQKLHMLSREYELSLKDIRGPYQFAHIREVRLKVYDRLRRECPDLSWIQLGSILGKHPSTLFKVCKDHGIGGL